MIKTISIGGDHAGFEYKRILVEMLQSDGYEVTDRGPFSTASCDYPDYAHLVAADVESGTADAGILLCGRANGVAITANKHQPVRAAIAWNNDVALLARQHNNANVLAIPARFVSIDCAKSMTNLFLKTEFEGGRHQRRIEKIPLKP